MTKSAKIDKSGKETQVEILVVDHEVSYLELVSRLLAAEGYKVDITLDAKDALNKIRRKRYNLLIAGQPMPGMKFFELYEHVKTIDPSLAKRTFVLDVSVTETHMREFLTKNKLFYMSRPFNL